jgi:hypothetical protein
MSAGKTLQGFAAILAALVLWASAAFADLSCGVCKREITSTYITSKGRTYHETCYLERVAPRCVVCAQPITSHYYKDPWGNVFHSDHKVDTPQCVYCSRIIAQASSQGGVRYGDGRTVCNLCRVSAVDDESRARKLLGGVRKTLTDFGITLAYGNIPLSLGDRNWLQVMRARNPSILTLGEATAFTSTVTSTINGAVVGKTVGIYALNGLPLEIFNGTIAHELMHAWNHLNCTVRHIPELEEGSANYAEVLVLQKMGTTAAKQHIRNLETSQDPVYGNGYRRVKRYVDDNGFDSLLDWLRDNADLPPGY